MTQQPASGYETSLGDNDSNGGSEELIAGGTAPRGRKAQGSKSIWTEAEDAHLKRLFKECQGSFKTIASFFPNRTAVQCRERWHYHLNPNRKKLWTKEEDRILYDANQRLGNQWAKIAKLLPQRSHEAIKRHWYLTLRRHGKSSDGSRSKNSGAKRNSTSSCSQPSNLMIEFDKRYQRQQIYNENYHSMESTQSNRIDDEEFGELAIAEFMSTRCGSFPPSPITITKSGSVHPCHFASGSSSLRYNDYFQDGTVGSLRTRASPGILRRRAHSDSAVGRVDDPLCTPEKPMFNHSLSQRASQPDSVSIKVECPDQMRPDASPSPITITKSGSVHPCHFASGSSSLRYNEYSQDGTVGSLRARASPGILRRRAHSDSAVGRVDQMRPDADAPIKMKTLGTLRSRTLFKNALAEMEKRLKYHFSSPYYAKEIMQKGQEGQKRMWEPCTTRVGDDSGYSSKRKGGIENSLPHKRALGSSLLTSGSEESTSSSTPYKYAEDSPTQMLPLQFKTKESSLDGFDDSSFHSVEKHQFDSGSPSSRHSAVKGVDFEQDLSERTLPKCLSEEDASCGIDAERNTPSSNHQDLL